MCWAGQATAPCTAQAPCAVGLSPGDDPCPHHVQAHLCALASSKGGPALEVSQGEVGMAHGQGEGQSWAAHPRLLEGLRFGRETAKKWGSPHGSLREVGAEALSTRRLRVHPLGDTCVHAHSTPDTWKPPGPSLSSQTRRCRSHWGAGVGPRARTCPVCA